MQDDLGRASGRAASATASRTTTTTPSTAARSGREARRHASRCGSRASHRRRDGTALATRSPASTSRTGRAGHRPRRAGHRQRGLHRREPRRIRRAPSRRSTSTSTSTHCSANGVTPDVWDVDAQGVPHDLGVLSHYDVVLWYLGDNRLTQDPEDELTEFFGDRCPTSSVAERQQYLTMAVRDFLNEGGKLAYAGETAGVLRPARRRAWAASTTASTGRPSRTCAVTFDPFSDCLLLADDFTQYYLGAYARTPLVGRRRHRHGRAARRARGALRRSGHRRQPGRRGRRARRRRATSCRSTSSRSSPAGRWPTTSSAAGSVHPDRGDVRGRGVARRRRLHAAGADLRPHRGHRRRRADVRGPVLVRHRGGLRPRHRRGPHRRPGRTGRRCPTSNGGTSTDVPAECEAGFLIDEHPQPRATT